MPAVRGARADRLLRPVHEWIWGDRQRRVRKLFAFADVEAAGGRDILRAAEVTSDPLLRRLYLAHAIDELHHADLFNMRGAALLRALGPQSSDRAGSSWMPTGGHGLDDLRVEDQGDQALLAFLHLSEQAAAGRFAIYRDVVRDDPPTAAVFDEILRDEVFHMTYTQTQLARIAPTSHRWRLWRARATRLWKHYLRVAGAVAGVLGMILLTVQYFVLLPPFAWLAKRAARRDAPGWSPAGEQTRDALTSQY